MAAALELKHKAGQDSIWAAIRKLGEFTRKDVIFELSKEFGDAVDPDTVKSYIQRLTRGGFVAPTGRRKSGGHQLYLYKLINDCGNTAPRLKADGSRSLLGAVTESLWRTMKILGGFNIRELQAAATTETVQPSYEMTREYCQQLCNAGYLRRPKRGRYRLVPSRYTGPKPPVVTKTEGVYDANDREIVYVKPVEVSV
ncbi:hypothetical protein [Thalassolituus sp. UBA3500]|uniref:hypothetical protein n=1 Tax=Thalassolituus sp. UBA3500 TaxID=1947664 RepID=UPI000C0E30D5|nr:hypothetical protein [Thalassolituus sp. UBA3500]MBN57828.1 hypothetical protein [Oceanospirillaceae bacterium]|tara:strand:+ start:2572 stop:3165 length:594 start_codon:yes stop_codon:yes gene_type:complete